MKPLNTVQIPRRFVREEWGGIETVILETGKQLLKMGHHCEVLCPNALATTNEEIIEGLQVTRTPYIYPYWGISTEARHQLDKKAGNLFSFSLMRRLRSIHDLDVIHLHTQKRLGGIARHVARERGIPYVISLHGGILDVPSEEKQSWVTPTQGTFEWGKVLGWWVGSRRVIDDAAAILCGGIKEQRLVQKQFPDKWVIYLPNGVDVKKFSQGDGLTFRTQHNISRDAHVILTVARIDPQKNQLMLVRALPRLLEHDPKAHLLMVGPVTSEDYHERILETIKNHGLEQNVTIIPGFTSNSQDLLNCYHSADLFVLPSVHEPFGIVILEAWSAGLPVLAGNVGGIPCFVEDGVNGLLFDPNDDETFVRLFQTLNPDKMKDLAKAGQEKALQEYTWERITSQLTGIYDNVCAGKARG